ncbi:inorganic pyrophosphatase [Breznakia sp. PF5-3]|uniref:inorganic diphosphatase n=1 Tax=unclassified Breznakia TaxID=2623764 RepID=UPI002406D4BD|nr:MULTISPECIES: inorganic diphosphatase [unclassified Breznakia]MDF9824011.1 inorganic pyrophosphatase [Breznakia sp. PM6-1]MDF9834810.1 inorganic pyrophosphatase [Breznakia sp. PF5-3]MDF9838129.1 inorganic pyrophosphatase [Breznakia sp. PFB2-8]MDF9860115.1 inorganic pyrophosphatase [Breznakia sp. PH5-24]
MKEFENNALFWQKLDTIFLSSTLKIERAKDTQHPKYANMVYPVDYGYLQDTIGSDNEPIDVFSGKEKNRQVQAIVVSADILKRDCEVKIIMGCSEAEIHSILVFLNQTESQKAVLLRRGQEVPEWASNS